MTLEESTLSLYQLVKGIIQNNDFKFLLSLVIIILLIGTGTYSFIEGWSFLDSLYYSVITLTTVGYGDFSPVTSLGKIITIFYVFIGIAILFGFINIITDQALKNKIREKHIQRRKDKERRKKK